MNRVEVIENSKNKIIRLELKKLWQFRALLKIMTLRDIKVQYTQTRLGFIWSFIQAIAAALVMNFFFGMLLKVNTGEIPFIVFAFPGMIAWYYFSYIVSYSGVSLMQSQHIIKKVYFPKLILPLSKAFVGMFELVIWFIVYFALSIIYKQGISFKVLLLPIGIILNLISGLSIAIWLAAITVKKRDALLIIPFVIGFGIFVTPVFYATTMIPPQYEYLAFLNPMAGVIAFYRWCLMDLSFDLQYLLGFIPVITLLISGTYYFRKVEGKMADTL